MTPPAITQIQTSRLQLVAINREILDIEKASRIRFSRFLQAEVPEAWPPPSLIPLKPWLREQLLLNTDKIGWYLWYGILRRPLTNILILSCGFMEPPDAQGGVEIGYALLERWRGQGLATEAAKALMHWAFNHPEIHFLRARVARGNLASARILENCGFERIASDPLKPAINRYICYR